MTEKKFNDILNYSSSYDALLRYAPEADFQTVARSAAQNETWRDTTSETLWDILGACGKDINNIASEAALDYVQNLSDINTARIPALVSMASMLKYETGSLKDLYESFPVGLQLMVDMFSVDREYLFGGDSPMLSVPMVRKLMERLKESLMQLMNRTPEEELALNDVFTEIKLNNHKVSAEQYRALIKEIFYSFILEILDAGYCETDKTKVINNLLAKQISEYGIYRVIPGDTIIDKMVRGESRHPLDLPETTGSCIQLDPKLDISVTGNSLAEQVENMCRGLNISNSFNPWAIADEIVDHGLSPKHALTPNEISVVETILNAHNKERFDYANGHYLLGEIETRNGYYRERELVKYLKVFTMMRSINVQQISLDIDTINQINLAVGNADTSTGKILDFYTYVNKDWIYDEDGAKPEHFVDNSGIGKPIIPRPVYAQACDPKFIPRVGSYVRNIRYKVGYEYDTEYMGMTRTIDLESKKPTDVLEQVAEVFTDLVFKIHYMRNEMKRQAQFNAMRGTGSLLTHAINDFLLSKYPADKFQVVPKWAPAEAYEEKMRELVEKGEYTKAAQLQKQIEENIELHRNFTNVDIVEYMDTTDYYNIQPTSLYSSNDERLATRYWEQLSRSITNRDRAQLGELTPNEIRDFYRNGMSMRTLHSTTDVEDDIEEFLVSLYESGASETHYDPDSNSLVHPINDSNIGDSSFAYTSTDDRIKVQNNADLLEKQDREFLRYSADTRLPNDKRERNSSGQVIESYNWKNSQFASVMLHPFLYTFELWNPLVNIIVNAVSEYVTEELEKSLSTKKAFDELYGKYGESKDFWKYNTPDLTGYMSRYEKEKHGATDSIGRISPVTGYDGEFYPSAVFEFIMAYKRSKERTDSLQKLREAYAYTPLIPNEEDPDNPWENPISIFRPSEYEQANVNSLYESFGLPDDEENPKTPLQRETLEQVIASIYWQIETADLGGKSSVEVKDLTDYQTFYGRWYAHLGYPDEKLRFIAQQLWYWKDRIEDAATHRYDVTNYTLDIGNNSMFLLDTFKDEEDPKAKTPMAITALDRALLTTNDILEMKVNINHNLTAGKCYTLTERPKELWVRWNSEPIAFPAFDIWWDNEALVERGSGDRKILPHDDRFKYFGQIPYKDNNTNDVISDIIERFLDRYVLDGTRQNIAIGNKAPIFYSFEQNAGVFLFSAWDRPVDTHSFLADYDRSHFCPVYVLTKEVQQEDGTYNFETYLEDVKSFDFIGETLRDTYISHQCIFSSSRGSLVIPAYRISTDTFKNDKDAYQEWEDVDEEGKPVNKRFPIAENRTVLKDQQLNIRLTEIICQSVVASNYETNKLLKQYGDKRISINEIGLFGGTVLIANGTSVEFSLDGDNIGLAFLGSLTESAKDILTKNVAGGIGKYIADSEPLERTAFLRKPFYKVNGEKGQLVDGEDVPEKDKYTIGEYADLRIADVEHETSGDITDENYSVTVPKGPDRLPIQKTLWNSFDRNDKFLCVLKYKKTLDTDTWDDNSDFSARLCNIISDASYISEFAYQSPSGLPDFPNKSGMNRLYNASYFKHRNHWPIQLMGLENPDFQGKTVKDYLELAESIVVHDETDDVDTYVNPGDISDALYRIWEGAEHTNRDKDGNYVESPNLLKMYNPTLKFDEDGVATWTERFVLDKEGFDVLLDRYVFVTRCDDKDGGKPQNEKNWIVRQMPLKDLISDVDNQNEEEVRKLPIDRFHTESLSNDGKSRTETSWMLVGTQDYCKHTSNADWPTTVDSPAYLLMYGNGIPGVRGGDLKVTVKKRFPTPPQIGEFDVEKVMNKKTGDWTGKLKLTFKDVKKGTNAIDYSMALTYWYWYEPTAEEREEGQTPGFRQLPQEDAEPDVIVEHSTEKAFKVITPVLPSIPSEEGEPDTVTERIKLAMTCYYEHEEGQEEVTFTLEKRFNVPENRNKWTVEHVEEVHNDFEEGPDPYQPDSADAPYIVEITMRFYKHNEEVEAKESPALKTYMDGIGSIAPKSMLLGISEHDSERLADYHMLVHHDDIFFNIPNPDEDEKLRADMKPHNPDARDTDPDWSVKTLDKNGNEVTTHKEANYPVRSLLDYLYIYEGSTAFKVNEQSPNGTTFDWQRPILDMDKLLYNYRRVQVGLNCFTPWSTYITQEHNPDEPQVRKVEINAIPGVDHKGLEEFDTEKLDFENLIVDAPKSALPAVWECPEDVDPTDRNAVLNRLIADGYTVHGWERVTDGAGAIHKVIDASGSDFDQIYKIYATYVKVDCPDDARGYHFDLFFNLQNIFKPPFEYISSFTGQPMPLIPKNSYLYLSGKDEDILAGEGGKLTLYAQMKWMVNDITRAVKLIPLVTYDIYNISDDKPKFLLKRAANSDEIKPDPPLVSLEFEDIHLTLPQTAVNEIGELTEPFTVVQKLSVKYNNTVSDYGTLKKLAFNIVQNKINTKILPHIDPLMSLAYSRVRMPQTAEEIKAEPLNVKGTKTLYPARYNSKYTSMTQELTGYRVSLTYTEPEYTNEDLYLYWVFPKGMNLMDAIVKMGCIAEDNAVKCDAETNSGDAAVVESKRGRIYVDNIGNPRRLGREHGKHLNKHGFVLKKVSEQIREQMIPVVK